MLQTSKSSPGADHVCLANQTPLTLTCFAQFDKTSVSRTIYDALSQAGSRFLRHCESLDLWEELSPMSARDKIGHALRFANRNSRRKHDTYSPPSGVDCKPAPATPQSHLIAPSEVQPTGVHSTLQVQSMGQLPVASLSTRMDGFVLGYGDGYIPVDCASLGDSCETYQSIEPFAMVDKVENEEHYLTVSNELMPSSVFACSMGVHEEARGGTDNLLQRKAPSHATLNESISLLNSALCESMQAANQGHSAALGLDDFEQGPSTAEWDFDAEIVSVLF
jgi:hypothetical protein